MWCFQFGILPRLLWPLTVYEIPITKVEKLERLKQWLGLPRCLSSVGLYGHGRFELPITGLVEEFKCTKARLVMTLTESEDAVIRTAEGSGFHQKLFRVQSLRFDSEMWLDKYSMGGQGLDSSQKLLCGTKQHQCRRDG